jgi:hypothetical protein
MSLNKIKGGMVFAGCSFTWGQGLYFYSNMPTLDYSNTNSFSMFKIHNAHIKYMETLRFPRLVANHFETFEIVNRENGGSDDCSIEFIERTFSGPHNVKMNYNEISHIIFQTSDLTRNSFNFNHEGVEYKHIVFNQPKNEEFYKWQIKNNFDFHDVMEILREQAFSRIKELFVKYEQLGIVCKILCWTDDYINLIKSDPFFDGKFINFEYNNETYDCIDYLTKINKGMSVDTDIVNLNTVISDGHPSKQCHRLIADSIIKHIENDNI